MNFYQYVSLFCVLTLRIVSLSWLIKSENLIVKVEVCAISLFVLCNTTTLIIWARRCVLFRLEESSEFYVRIKLYSHVLTALV